MFCSRHFPLGHTKAQFLLLPLCKRRLSRANEDTAVRWDRISEVRMHGAVLFQTIARADYGGGECLELYFLKNGRYIAHAHTPLAWTHPNQTLALHLMEQTVGEKR